jgi:hypothetical protein
MANGFTPTLQQHLSSQIPTPERCKIVRQSQNQIAEGLFDGRGKNQ